MQMFNDFSLMLKKKAERKKTEAPNAPLLDLYSPSRDSNGVVDEQVFSEVLSPMS